MWLSSTAQQAIQAVLCIADCGHEGPVRVDEIAAVIGVPRNYLSKTLHTLTRSGVIRSQRGPRGGFWLATTSELLTLARVIEPFEPIGERRCLVGRTTCGDANPCVAHNRWKKVAGGVDDFFKKTTIADLVQGNPRASAEARRMMRTVRRTNLSSSSHARTTHGSVA
jgi:Rrf2 family protein